MKGVKNFDPQEAKKQFLEIYVNKVKHIIIALRRLIVMFLSVYASKIKFCLLHFSMESQTWELDILEPLSLSRRYIPLKLVLFSYYLLYK